MGKFLRILITFTAVAIALCIFVAISKLGTAGTPILLQFAQNHFIALRWATFLMISVAGLLILIELVKKKGSLSKLFKSD